MPLSKNANAVRLRKRRARIREERAKAIAEGREPPPKDKGGWVPKIDPATGKRRKSPVREAAEAAGIELPPPAQDPVTGKFLKGNSMALKPGMTANPEGKPVGMSAAYRAQLRALVPKNKLTEDCPTGSNWAQQIALTICQMAANGVVSAAVEVRNATEGAKVRHETENWREEVELLGLDPDFVMGKFRELIETLVKEKERLAADA